MKKVGKIKIALYLFIALVFLLGIFHDSLLSNLFRNVILGKSKGKIELPIDSFHFGMRNGTISIFKPVLLFDDLYVDEARSVKVERIAFDRVIIEGLDILSLIFKKEIVANRVFVDKPEFWLVEDGTASKSKVQPDGFVDALKQNNNQFSEFKASIDDIEIHYGYIRLSKYALSDLDPGQVDFTINLKGFTTNHDTIKNNLALSSTEFTFKIRHLHKLLSSGYVLDIDSVIYSSINKSIVVDAITYFPSAKRKGKNSIGFVSRRVAFDNIGLDDFQKMNNTHLSSVVLSDGTFINYINENSTSSKNTSQNSSADVLEGVLKSLVIDTISINAFNYYNIRNEHDTLITVSDIDFRVTDVEIDSSMHRDILNRIGFEEISLNTGYVNVEKVIPDVSFGYNKLSYSNSDRAITVSGLKVYSDSTESNSQTVNLTIPEFRMRGISLHGLQKQKKQAVSIYLDNPYGEFSIGDLVKKDDGKQQKISLPIDLYFYEIGVNNGNFKVVNDGFGNADISGLNLSIAGMQLPERENDSLYFESVNMSSSGINAFFEKEKLKVQVGDMSYQTGMLLLNRISLQQKTLTGKKSFNIQTFSVSGFDKDRFLNNQELYFDTILLSKPMVKGSFGKNRNDAETSDNSFKEIVSPVQFSVNTIVLEDGVVNTSVVLKEEVVELEAGYNISFGVIDVKRGDTLQTVLENLRWQIRVDNLNANSFNHKLQIGSMLADSYRSEFLVENILVTPDSSADTESDNFYIRSFKLPLFEISELDYNLLLWNDSLSCSAIHIDNPFVDMTFIEGEDATPKEKKGKLINLNDIIVFSYDTIDITGLNFDVERKGEGKDQFINVQGLDFSHYKMNTSKSNNLIANIIFKLDEVNFYNKLTSQNFTVSKSFIDRVDNSLFIESINSYHLNKDGSDVVDKKGIGFDLDNIELSGIMVEPNLPTRVSANKLEVKDINLDLVIEKSENRPKKKLAFTFDIMKRFSNVMTLVQLDTALMDDVSFSIRTISETENSTINLDSIGIFIEKIKLDTCIINMSKPTIIDQITLDLKGKTRISKDSLYEIHSGKLYYNFPNQKIVVDSFYLTPLFEPQEFFSRAKYQTDRIDLFVPRIEIDDINIDELVTNNHLKIDHVNLYSLKAEMYRDKHYPIKPGIYKQLPREQIMGIEKVFSIDSILLFDSYLKYKELSEKTDQPGEIYIDNINVSAYNFTNRLKKDEKKDLTVQFNGRIMGQTEMNLNLHFPLNSDGPSYILAGKTDKMNLSILNPLTTNLLGIGIIKGKGSVDIRYIEGSDSIAKGSVIFRYNNLRLLPYSRQKEKLRSGMMSPLFSFMINDLVVKSNNPRFARKPRVGHVFFVRDTRKGVVNYVWKGVLSGIMSTMGFSTKEQRKEKKEVKR